MSIFKTIRASEWWGYKLAPLLAVGYATILHGGGSLAASSFYLLYVLLALALGAAYVSVINDITDMEEDLAIGKHNRMASVPASRRWIFPALALLAGACYIASFYPHIFVMALACMPWIAFSCYSFEPIRLKRRGILGVLADASGAHLFTSLFIVAAMSYYTHQSIDWWWFGGVGFWALGYGLRGILWHQFMDRENDLASGTKTFATRISPAAFRIPGRLILLLEMLGLAVMLWRLDRWWPIIGLGLYGVFAAVCAGRLRIRLIAIQMPPGQDFRIFLFDYYMVFLPLALLVPAALAYPYDWIVLVLHAGLFFGPIRSVLALAARALR